MGMNGQLAMERGRCGECEAENTRRDSGARRGDADDKTKTAAIEHGRRGRADAGAGPAWISWTTYGGLSGTDPGWARRRTGACIPRVAANGEPEPPASPADTAAAGATLSHTQLRYEPVDGGSEVGRVSRQLPPN